MKNNKNIAWRLMPFQIFTLVAFAAAALFLLPFFIQKSAEQHAVSIAEKLASQIKVTRSYYSSNVVKKIIDNDTVLHPSVNHKNDATGIPLPASFIHDLGDLLNEETFQLSFYSPYPFENRKDRKLSSFGKQAWAELSRNPDTPYYQQEIIDGKTVIKVAIADKMANEICVDCHNSHPLSLKTDWEVGQLRGIIEISSDITNLVSSGRETGYLLAGSLLFVFGVLLLFSFKAILNEIQSWGDKLSKQSEALAKAQEIANAGSWYRNYTDEDEYWSDGLYALLGIDKNTKATGETLLSAVHPDDVINVVESHMLRVTGELEEDMEYRIVRQDNQETRWVHERCEYIRNQNGDITSSNVTIQDITESKLAQQKIEHLAMTDQLTSLANRMQFNLKFDEYLSLAKREKQRLAIMLLDLDKFKPVNDTYGHQAGDSLLQQVSKIFLQCCRETDIVARIGGDEFAIILVNPTDNNGIAKLAQRIIQEIEKPIMIGEHQIQIGTSIGIAAYPEDGIDKEHLIHNADTALYAAKDAGRNQYCFYKTGM